MGLIKCGKCGQSMNPKRDVCPFCGAGVEKKPSRFAMPTRAVGTQAAPSVAQPDNPLPAAEPSAVSPPGTSAAAMTPEWLKKPKVLIVIAVGVVALAVLGGVLVMNARANNARKAEAMATLVPFHRLQSAVTWGKVSISLDDYQKYVRDAQYAYDSYKPSDARGREFAKNLKEAALGYSAALAGWQLQEASWELLSYDADREAQMEDALGGIWKESDRLVKQAEKAFD